jgi:GGDEF domain-containing protein/CHASE3 domain sensor protein
MLSGYMVLVLLTVIVVTFALVNIQRLNRLSSSIVTVDVPVQEASDKMRDAIFAQDNYEKKFLILNTSDMRKLFYKRGEDFKQWLNSVKDLPKNEYKRLHEIAPLYEKYTGIFDREIKLIAAGKRGAANRLSNNDLKKTSEAISSLLAEQSKNAIAARDEKMKRINSIGRTAFLMTTVLSALSVLLGILGSLVVTHHISSSINKLSTATRQIAEGNFDYDPGIRANDEVGALASAFIDMGKRLRKLEEMYLDASPLTRLPGGIAIENVLKKRIEAGLPIAFCMIDLDNFKSYNDRYGYAQGSEVLKETAHLIESAVKTKGSNEDFIGHIGGDDFVLITVPDRMRLICEEIIVTFDRRIPEFYDEGDRKNGFILGKTRQGLDMKFPLITISIAIVTNERRVITSPLEASEVAAELKDYAKTLPKSIYVIDKRRNA